MNEYMLKRTQTVSKAIGDVFSFFADAGNLDTLTPPWLRFEIVTPRPIELKPGALIEYRLRWHGLRIAWVTRIEEWSPPHRFVDTQIRGPYKLWHHTHEFAPANGGTSMTDIVRYALPLGPIGRIAHAIAVRRDVAKIFDYRFRRIAELFGDPGHAVAGGRRIGVES